MTVAGWLPIVLTLALVLAAGHPLGRHLADLFEDRPTILSPVLRPVERALYRLAGVDAAVEQDWLTYAPCMLAFAGGCFVLLCALLRLQDVLALNPGGFAAVPPDLAFNTAVGVIANANWQAYGGETTMSLPTQMLGLAALYHAEASANPLLAGLGVDPALGNLEGKDLRFGQAAPARARPMPPAIP